MATNTPNLNLLKKDPVADGNETFNIQTMLNENWDKIDAAMGEIDIPDASLTVKGKVQLSSETDSDAEDRAATPKAVSEVALQAKSYTDQQISLVTETGIPKLVSYPLLVTATVDGQTDFEIPLDLFDANTDTLFVSINRATLDSTHYTITNTVLNSSGQVAQRAKIKLLSGVKAGSKISMFVLKNVPIGPEGSINGAVLAVDSIPINRVKGLEERFDEQLADVVRHITAAERTKWNNAVTDIGTKANLITAAKGDLVSAINELFTSASNGKTAVAAAITGKGVPASGSDTFSQLATKIGQIVTGKKSASGTATTNSFSRFSISGLDFRPDIVFWQSTNHPDTYGFIKDGMKWAVILYNGSTSPTLISDQFFTISDTGVANINAYWSSSLVIWVAYE
ncbi:phage tail protein [Paenibacillus barengoltzii]|uniref:phage tail protein n=1 Tax=Paenibacillus barengoltzii TaxID=343517 RepID=UPI002DBDECD3|nr:phage tail protein [Paenibacillus barengoltzii]MEC2342985.1 phage tail protein [Paenibacillus barengoltzii]